MSLSIDEEDPADSDFDRLRSPFFSFADYLLDNFFLPCEAPEMLSSDTWPFSDALSSKSHIPLPPESAVTTSQIQGQHFSNL